MDQFKKYIKSTVKGIYDSEEQKELEEELLDHLNLLKEDYLAKGYSEDKAIKLAIKDFGNSREIGNGLEKSMFPYKRVGQLALIVIAVFISMLAYKSITEIGGYSHGGYGSALEISIKLKEENLKTRTYQILLRNKESIEINIASILVGSHPVKMEAKPKVVSIKPKGTQEFIVVFPKLRSDEEKRDNTYIQIKGTIIDRKGNPKVIEIANAVKVSN